MICGSLIIYRMPGVPPLFFRFFCSLGLEVFSQTYFIPSHPVVVFGSDE